MSVEVAVVSSTSFPQSNSNRTREQAEIEIAEYVAGGSRAEVLVRAGRCWDAAVREFNSISWRFNRRSQDITLVADTTTYSLSSTFRSPLRAVLLDSTGLEKWPLTWLSHEDFIECFGWGSSSRSSFPDFCTAFNTHNEGLIRFEPSPTGTLTYPTARVLYLCYIALAPGKDDRLNVPLEVDEAIVQLASATLLDRTRGGDAARDMFARAKNLRFTCELEYREWPVSTGWGANG